MITVSSFAHYLFHPRLATSRLKQKFGHRLAPNSTTLILPSEVKYQVLREYAREHKISTFIETGTYLGGAITALHQEFREIHSVELADHFYQQAVEKFAGMVKVHLWHGDSGELLPEIVKTLRVPALFWLDGHFSGGNTAQADIFTPIEAELACVLVHPQRHVVLIDDAREFVGLNSYPTIEAVQSLATKHGYEFELRHDIIRLTPAK